MRRRTSTASRSWTRIATRTFQHYVGSKERLPRAYQAEALYTEGYSATQAGKLLAYLAKADDAKSLKAFEPFFV